MVEFSLIILFSTFLGVTSFLVTLFLSNFFSETFPSLTVMLIWVLFVPCLFLPPVAGILALLARIFVIFQGVITG